MNRSCMPPFSARRQQVAISLEELGCREVEGGLCTDWVWECRICGVTVYVEIPSYWPLPKGPGEPSALKMWMPSNRIPSCWFHLLGERKVIGGKTAQLVCVDADPETKPAQLLLDFKRRFRELCGRC